MKYTVEQISNDLAEQLCRQITFDLPEYFGLPECNELYARGVREHINFAVMADNRHIGLLSLGFPYPKSSNIYWMGVLRQYQGQGIGSLLIEEACRYAAKNAATIMTVETLAPAGSDENYLKTYHFYASQSFNPLFNLKPMNYEWNMVYMAKDLKQYRPRQAMLDTIEIRAIHANDIPMIVNHFALHHWIKPASTFETYWLEQNKNLRLTWLAFYQNHFAGYVTLKWHSAYPPFSKKQIPEIMDLNVLPPYRNKGIGSILLAKAENEAGKLHEVVGLGVGLYKDYGPAQKLYISKGYMPDGQGITYQYKSVTPGKKVCLDDDLILWFTKRLKSLKKCVE